MVSPKSTQVAREGQLPPPPPPGPKVRGRKADQLLMLAVLNGSTLVLKPYFIPSHLCPQNQILSLANSDNIEISFEARSLALQGSPALGEPFV